VRQRKKGLVAPASFLATKGEGVSKDTKKESEQPRLCAQESWWKKSRC
jgi:hypothetical protein